MLGTSLILMTQKGDGVEVSYQVVSRTVTLPCEKGAEPEQIKVSKDRKYQSPNSRRVSHVRSIQFALTESGCR